MLNICGFYCSTTFFLCALASCIRPACVDSAIFIIPGKKVCNIHFKIVFPANKNQMLVLISISSI